ADRDHAGLHELADAEGLEHGEEVVQLVGVAGDLDRHGVGRHVDHLGLEELHRVEHLATRLGVGPDLDQQQLTAHRGGATELDDLEHLDQLVELLGHLLQGQELHVDDDGHPGDLGMLGRTDREAVDVEATTAEEGSDTGQDAGLVLDQDGEGVLAHQRSSSSNWGAMSRAYWMASLLVPEATIGHTMASRCTRKSTTTGWSLIAMAFWIVASTSASESHERPTQP